MAAPRAISRIDFIFRIYLQRVFFGLPAWYKHSTTDYPSLVRNAVRGGGILEPLGSSVALHCFRVDAGGVALRAEDGRPSILVLGLFIVTDVDVTSLPRAR